jgi:hypothetical protein
MAWQAGLVSAKIANRFTICTAGHQARSILKTRPTIVVYRAPVRNHPGKGSKEVYTVSPLCLHGIQHQVKDSIPPSTANTRQFL